MSEDRLQGAPSGPGSREPGPSVPASGFDPSRVADPRADEQIIADLERYLCVKGTRSVFRRALEIAKAAATEARASAVANGEAPDTIDKLKKENAELREALRPFADAVYDAGGIMLFSNTQPSRADWLRARTLLTQSSEVE